MYCYSQVRGHRRRAGGDLAIFAVVRKTPGAVTVFRPKKSQVAFPPGRKAVLTVREKAVCVQ